MHNSRLRLAATLGGGFLVVLALFAFVLYSGTYPVGVTDGHTAPIEWLLRTGMEASVGAHAAGIEVPDTLDLDDRTFATQFFGHYRAACRTCHGAPGRPADPWMVIYPEALDLTDEAVVAQWSDAELFWILKHGIKDTGMMALGPTHAERDIWGVTALVRQLPTMTAEAYDAMERRFQAMQAAKDPASGEGGM